MTVDFEREVSAALHDVADDLPPPPLDLTRVRRGGRRRRAGATAFAACMAILAAGAVAGVIRLAGPWPGTGHEASARAGAEVTAATAAMADVRAFYAGYQAASRRGWVAVNKLIAARTARWYAPALEARVRAGVSPIECGHTDSAGLHYQRRGEVAGQFVFVVGSPLWHSPEPESNVVLADAASARITGITCSISGRSVPPADSHHSAARLYQGAPPARRQEFSVHPAPWPVA